MAISDAERDKRAALIADTADGIYPPYEIYYICHIQSVARLSAKAFLRFEELAVAHRHQQDFERTFEELQTALSHAAALSRFFWPSSNGLASVSKKRGAKLREGFDVQNDNPLKDRGLRNAIEHYDERLDEYLLDPTMGATVSLHVGSNILGQPETGFILREVDVVNAEVGVLGRRYSYGSIKQEITRIVFLADQLMSNGCRLPRAA